MSLSTISRTRFTELLGIEYPLAQAGMGSGLANPDVVAGVSNAGGLGVLGASSMSADEVVGAIATIRASTARPFGVNFLISPAEGECADTAELLDLTNDYRSDLGMETLSSFEPPAPDLTDDAIEAALGQDIPLISFGLGDPSPYVEAAHRAGSRVMAMVTNVADAKTVADAAVDVIVAQGSDAGGHRSDFHYASLVASPMVGTFSLVPQVVDAVDVPVLAAGGVMDGRGLAAAIVLGADGVLMGTRFLLAEESSIFSAYREALLRGAEDQTIVSTGPTGRLARSIRNRLTDELSAPSLPFPHQAEACFDVYLEAWKAGRPDLFPLWSGQGLRMATRIQPAGEIVAEVAKEAEDVLEKLCQR